ncbi:NAD(+) diphosphatase [Luteimonas sp. SX5]|uniref:NAD(+) diphosphatase n=1 Tax=Luteimonas galliterrae TaxID=2940486 RepID=A0ABT0ML16_9GAMM|nr:NAD(+) diphosphatase [Luteimonas galliterrae]MCL1635576.1 NAD(+) diphosphatase [Luteimonas galliterrae]
MPRPDERDPQPTFAFSDPGPDRADHLRDDPAALAERWAAGKVLLIDNEGQAAVDADRALLATDGATLDYAVAQPVFLGLSGEQAWFAARTTEVDTDAAPRIDLRSAAALWPAFEASLFAQARAVLHWQGRHRHCSVCGGAIEFQRGGWLGRCAACAAEHYPRTDPAVIVAITDGERLLLGRQASWPARRYSTLAGFVEPGESLEQTVAREVLEESGVRVRSSRYLASQPWPFPGSLMLGFMAQAEPDEPRASDELEDARWFTHDEIGAALRGETGDEGLLVSPSISISRWLIEQWHAHAGAARPR